MTAPPTLDVAAYIKAATETGELLTGIEAVPARESFSIKTGGSAKYGAE